MTAYHSTDQQHRPFTSLTDKLGPRRMINRVEYVRVIQQALYKLGYSAVAHQLEQDSGIQMQPQHASDFQAHVLAGQWDSALALLPQLSGNDKVLKDARFLILQQRYLECLEAGDATGALSCLRGELAPLGVHTQQLHHLAGLLLCGGPEGLGGGAGHRRELLAQLQALLPPSLLLPDSRLEVLVEQALTAQVSRCPFHNTPLEAGLSLFSDYHAGMECLPTQLAQVLHQHTDEVWHVAFSNNGTMLATASKDCTAIIWSIRSPWGASSSGSGTSAAAAGGASSNGITHHNGSGSASRQHLSSSSSRAAAAAPAGPSNSSNHTSSSNAAGHQLGGTGGSWLAAPVHTLRSHTHPVAFLSWSPDDRLLLTCSDDTLRLWDVASGQLLHTFHQHREAVTCCAWLPDSRRFVSGAVDKNIIMFDANGTELNRWKRPYRIQDLAVTHNGAALIIACSDRQIHILRLSDGREVTLHEGCPITSIALAPASSSAASAAGSSGSSHLLVALQSQAVHLWEVGELVAPYPLPLGVGPDPMEDQVPTSAVMEYAVPEGRQGRYVVRPSFGGADSNFVVHGGEDNQVYLWHRDTGNLLVKLGGHTGTVNAVSWNPANPYMLASASDDKTVRIWVAEVAMGEPDVAAATAAAAQEQARQHKL